MAQQTEQRRPRPGGGSVRPREEAGQLVGAVCRSRLRSPSPVPATPVFSLKDALTPCPGPGQIPGPCRILLTTKCEALAWWGGALCLVLLAPHLGN